MATRLVLMPYLQKWDGSALAIRLLCLPRGSPLDSLVAGQSVPFVTSTFKFDIHILTDIDTLPIPGGTAFTTITSPPPSTATVVFEALAVQFPIDPNPPRGVKPPGSKARKHLPLTYQVAAGYAGANSDICFIDDTYSCLMGQQTNKYTRLPDPNPKWAWGKVIAAVMRNPELAIATGLVRPLDPIPFSDPSILQHGGYVYFKLAEGSDASGLSSIAGGIKTYAARIPALTASRDLFTPVLFPVVDPAPAADYAELFAEAEDYDDGWAKTVHCTQPRQLNHLKETSDGPRPVKELGIRIGWDDEQITVWLNRQLDETQDFDSPLGVRGYRIDASIDGSNEWHSLVRARGPIPLPNIALDPFDGELSVEVQPAQQFAQKQGDFWLPMYFASWAGPSLVTTDENMLRLSGDIDISAKAKIRGLAPDIDLRYGKSYAFRVRFVDHSGGGPTVSGSPTSSGPSPTGKLAFRRWIRPMSLILLSPALSSFPSDPDVFNPPSFLEFARPLLTYPAVVCAGAPNAVQRLLADIQPASVERREPGLPDPDVTSIRFTVEVAGFLQDPLAVDAGYISVYTTSRPFPDDPAAHLHIDINWHPFDQLSDLVADDTPTAPLTLPEARSVRIRMTAECRSDPNYFGADDVRFGPNIYINIGKFSRSEINLFQNPLPSKAINGFFFQPDIITDTTSLTAQQASGNAQQAPSDIASRAANAFGLPNKDLTFYATPGRRAVFACAGALLHTISPDLGSITISSKSDLALHWIIVIRLTIARDWTWDGFIYNGITVQRDGVDIISFSPSRNIDAKILAAPDRTGTDLIIFDTLDPKPLAGAFPQELNPTYRVVCSLQGAPPTDAPMTLSIRLPVTSPPTQVPTLVSAGLAMSQYSPAADYSSTGTRQKALWLEFDARTVDIRDRLYARVLANAPDPLLSSFANIINPRSLPTTLEPPLPIDPEPMRKIIPGEASDPAGLDAMQELLPADPTTTPGDPRPFHFLLPLPPGTSSTSPSVFGFWTYEIRVGHSKDVWSTAQGRFGPPLRVAGIQHPPPELLCSVSRIAARITVSAPFAMPVQNDVKIQPLQIHTSMWMMLYAQARLLDGSSQSNILVLHQQMFGPQQLGALPIPLTDTDPGAFTFAPAVNTATFAACTVNVKNINAALAALGLNFNAKLSVLAVELLPPASAADPVGADLGAQRILRTSPLTAVPVIC